MTNEELRIMQNLIGIARNHVNLDNYFDEKETRFLRHWWNQGLSKGSDGYWEDEGN